MAEIRAFKALRFDTEKAGAIEELVCPPYDIISEEQRQEYIYRNPNSQKVTSLIKRQAKCLKNGLTAEF